MNLDDPCTPPNYRGWATSPVWPVNIAIGLLTRHALDNERWKGDGSPNEIFKTKKDKISKRFWAAQTTGKISADVKTFEDDFYNEDTDQVETVVLADYADSLVEKEVFLTWAKSEGFAIPKELDDPAFRYQTASSVANARWAPKVKEEEEVRGYVLNLLSQGCICDNEQMKVVVAEACDEKGVMLFPMKELKDSGIKKVIREAYREHYKDKADFKLRGCKGFKRTHNCKLHPK